MSARTDGAALALDLVTVARHLALAPPATVEAARLSLAGQEDRTPESIGLEVAQALVALVQAETGPGDAEQRFDTAMRRWKTEWVRLHRQDPGELGRGLAANVRAYGIGDRVATLEGGR